MTTSSEPLRPHGIVHAVRLTVVALCYFGFGFFGLLFAYIVLPWVWFFGNKAGRRRRAQLLLKAMSRGFFAVTDFFRLSDTHELDPAAAFVHAPGPMVIVCNHPSLIDILYLMSVLPPCVTVAKHSWHQGKLVGPLVRAGGHVAGPVDKDIAAGVQVLEDMLTRLTEGEKLLVFPEGTRSPTGSMHPFARGAFDAALKCKVPVVPLLLRVDPPVLRKGQPWWDTGRGRVHYGATLLPPRLPETFPKSSKTLCREVEALYEGRV